MPCIKPWWFWSFWLRTDTEDYNTLLPFFKQRIPQKRKKEHDVWPVKSGIE